MIKFIVERGKVEHLEMELMRVDGKKIWVLLFARLNSAKNILQVVMIDITLRKLTALKYQAIFNNSVAGMYITDLSTLKVTNVNEKGAEMLGYQSKEDFMDHYDPSNHYINPEDQQRNVKMIVEKGNGELFLEQRMKKLDGTPFWARVFIRIDQADNLIHAILLDITESKQTHEELERIVKERTLELTTLLEREKELNDLKSRFVSMASHEFRTPLSTILSSAFLIESCNLQEQEQQRQKHVGRIRSSVKNLTDILNDFLSVDKLEQGKIDVFKKSFDFSEFAQEIVDEVSLIKKSGQQIDFVYEGEKEIVQDKRILRNILLNLFSNAIKYSGENKTIYFYIHVSPERINISLRDEGIGIPEHEQKELFNRFFRASNASTIQGTGLGLNIVKRYLELIGGMIRFESSPEVGSTFIIELARHK
jgi:PAS domain S-box-containing protein